MSLPARPLTGAAVSLFVLCSASLVLAGVEPGPLTPNSGGIARWGGQKGARGKGAARRPEAGGGQQAAALAAGRRVYDANGCAGCHSIAGKGGAAGPDLTRTGAVPGHTVAWLMEQVAHPQKHNPNTSMPAYAGKIQPAQLQALGTYLASLKGAAPLRPSGTSPLGGGRLAVRVSAAARARLEQAGAQVSELAQGDPRLDVDYHLQGSSVTDASLAPLRGLKGIYSLNLASTRITDQGLANLRGMMDLAVLHLEGTKITDQGLANLKDLKGLTYLNLYNTGVTDAGLEQLTGLKSLKSLYLWETKATPAGAEMLKKALPGLYVNLGADVKG